MSELKDCNKPEGKLTKSGELLKLGTGWNSQAFYDDEGDYYERLRKGNEERWLTFKGD